jgi:hypothetical protein
MVTAVYLKEHSISDYKLIIDFGSATGIMCAIKSTLASVHGWYRFISVYPYINKSIPRTKENHHGKRAFAILRHGGIYMLSTLMEHTEHTGRW